MEVIRKQSQLLISIACIVVKCYFDFYSLIFFLIFIKFCKILLKIRKRALTHFEFLVRFFIIQFLIIISGNFQTILDTIKAYFLLLDLQIKWKLHFTEKNYLKCMHNIFKQSVYIYEKKFLMSAI